MGRGREVLDLEVDGRTAYTAAEIPLFNFGGDTAKAPAGFEGVQSSVALDPATGAVTVSESQRIMRCEVEAPGVRWRRTAATSSTPASAWSGPSA